jgi:hypothetical protein
MGAFCGSDMRLERLASHVNFWCCLDRPRDYLRQLHYARAIFTSAGPFVFAPILSYYAAQKSV